MNYGMCVRVRFAAVRRLTHRIQINAVQTGVVTSFGHCHWAVVVIVVVTGAIADAIGKPLGTGAMMIASISTVMMMVMIVVGCVAVVVVVQIVRIERTARCDVRRGGHRIVGRLPRARRTTF